jgi:hypothetical protein
MEGGDGSANETTPRALLLQPGSSAALDPLLWCRTKWLLLLLVFAGTF